jgi:twitching motility protein PilT
VSTSTLPANAPQIHRFLEALVQNGGSDLHLSAGNRPRLRINGDLVPVQGIDSLSEKQTQTFLDHILNENITIKSKLASQLNVDFAYAVPEVGRFRVNIFTGLHGLGAVFRVIPTKVPSVEDLGLPTVIRQFSNYSNGLVLICGPTGSGKSTTLAALIDQVNSTRSCHILTLEDPIEFVHKPDRAQINQREIETHVRSFADGLRSALREDPDVILVGEMRDNETIQLALTAAETGHLVFGTLHSQSSAKAIDRIIDVMPGDKQAQVRTQLSTSLRAIVTQQLLERRTDHSRIAAHEILIATPAIAAMIREEKIPQIPGMMSTARRDGMQTMNMALVRLARGGHISPETAILASADPETVRRELATNSPY